MGGCGGVSVVGLEQILGIGKNPKLIREKRTSSHFLNLLGQATQEEVLSRVMDGWMDG